MNLKNQNLLAIYLNEFNFDYLFLGAKKYKCNSILKILKLKKISTYTKDKELDYDLDPWVQSVSITTGKSSKEHKTFKLGERIEKNVNQIWDILVKNKISCAVWGSMNSRLKKNKYLNYYFPDPWNFKDKTWPKNLIGLYFLPNYYAKNYLKFSYLKFIYHSIQFIVTMILNSKFSNLLSDLSFLIRIVFKKGVNNFILYFMYDLIQLNIFNFHDQKKKSSFSIIFLNSIAHYQHNNWNEKNNEEYFFIFAEKLCSKILLLKKRFNSLIVFNGFTQKKIKSQYILRPKDPNKFISNFIKFKNLEQDMTIGGFIFFKSKKERNHSSNILNKLYCQNKKVFEIKNFNDDSIYYYINLRSSKVFSKNELEEPINLKKYLIDNFKNNEIKPKEKIDITNFLFKEIEFIKTTGVHSPEGLILYENVKSLNRFKRIENHKLFNSMLEHFDS